MTTSNFTIRGIPHEVMALLKEKAKENGISINLLILNLIDQRIGYGGQLTPYNDLDYLAGTWSEEEAAKFGKNIRCFETIDKELWA
jgi:hypothetical protein